VISPDGTIWDLSAGRPEPSESWEQTLRREMDEEACATVVGARMRLSSAQLGSRWTYSSM
jgi:NADH pyrophosphatase NudC (nudix superfamily)